MTSRSFLIVALSAAALAALSCSKTQDTAPERRIFGDPPSIEAVEHTFSSQAEARCDFTEIVFNLFCDSQVSDVEPQTGRGWTVKFSPDKKTRTIVFSDVPSTEPGVFIEGTYSQVVFKARVTDPNTVPGGQNNVLLVSSSFVNPVDPQAEDDGALRTETSLVLFDDGSVNEFEIPQRAIGVGEECEIDLVNLICTCTGARYRIKSGDEVRGDNVWTRAQAFSNPNSSGFFHDCIMRANHQTPIFAPANSTIEFKLEAVDRQGNLATWPEKIPVVTSTDTFVCNGDSCGCCMLHTFSPGLADQCECEGLPGMISPSVSPNGFCIDVIPSVCPD